MKKLIIMGIPVLCGLLGASMYLDYSNIQSINEEIMQMPPAAGSVSNNWKEGRILVKPKAGLPVEEFEKILKGNKVRSIDKIGALDVYIVSVAPQAEEAVRRALSNNPDIGFAELDMTAELTATKPNDPQFGRAWHLAKIQAPVAWDFSKADGITIAVLDTGVDSTHPDLVSKIIPGWNAVDGSVDTVDINGHGTAVAGAAAAASNNAVDVASIGWNARILPVRVTNSTDGYAYWSDIARGLDWTADNGARVANISYEVTGSFAITEAAQKLRSKGGLVVVAAGNSGIDPGLSDNPYMATHLSRDSFQNQRVTGSLFSSLSGQRKNTHFSHQP